MKLSSLIPSSQSNIERIIISENDIPATDIPTVHFINHLENDYGIQFSQQLTEADTVPNKEVHIDPKNRTLTISTTQQEYITFKFSTNELGELDGIESLDTNLNPNFIAFAGAHSVGVSGRNKHIMFKKESAGTYNLQNISVQWLFIEAINLLN